MGVVVIVTARVLVRELARTTSLLHIVHTSVGQYYNKLHLPTKSFQLLLHSR